MVHYTTITANRTQIEDNTVGHILPVYMAGSTPSLFYLLFLMDVLMNSHLQIGRYIPVHSGHSEESQVPKIPPRTSNI